MLEKHKIDEVADHINNEIQTQLGEKLESLYIVGSYAIDLVSSTRPDINWLLIWRHHIPGEDVWTLGKILTGTINKFEQEFTVRPEFRPFKFSYPLVKTQYDVFVNLTNVFAAETSEEFKKKNDFVPDYVFAGFKSTRKLIHGKDLLNDIDFEVSMEDIIETGKQKVMSHKIQLDRIPLTYHLDQEVHLIYNESVSHGKNLMYFGIEMIMTDEELRQNKFLDIIKDSNKTLEFYQSRLPEAHELINTIIDSKDNFPMWKYDRDRARDIYLASYDLATILLRKLKAIRPIESY